MHGWVTSPRHVLLGLLKRQRAASLLLLKQCIFLSELMESGGEDYI